MKDKLNYTTITVILLILTVITIISGFNPDPGIHLLGVRGFEIMIYVDGIFMVALGLYLLVIQTSWGQRILMRSDITELVALLKDGTQEERETAARLLGELHVHDEVETLRVAVEDGSAQVRRAAADSLYQLLGAWPLLEWLPRLSPKAQITVAHILLEHGDSVPNLVAYADRIVDPEIGQQVNQAVRSLSYLHETRYIDMDTQPC